MSKIWYLPPLKFNEHDCSKMFYAQHTHTQRSFGTILLSFLGPASETKRLQFSLSNWHCLLSPAHREMLHGRINALGSVRSLANQSRSYSTCPRFWWNISSNDEYLMRFWWDIKHMKLPASQVSMDSFSNWCGGSRPKPSVFSWMMQHWEVQTDCICRVGPIRFSIHTSALQYVNSPNPYTQH